MRCPKCKAELVMGRAQCCVRGKTYTCPNECFGPEQFFDQYGESHYSNSGTIVEYLYALGS